ncbi:MAG: hypothetical protein J6S50_05735 [Oscillospiraceae bacterium]|nr:hypothetical protein [Lachnospiraceae bacterium]MBO7727996.1 hypothetical protein [Oscillospiraceae bacterium]
MDDLISRQAAIGALAEEDNKYLYRNMKFSEIAKCIRALPSAQPEIIYCKDCKHWYLDADTGMACEFTNMGQPEDGFCNWAERGQDE